MTEPVDEAATSEPLGSEVWTEAHKITDDLGKKTDLRQGKVTIVLTIVCVVQVLLIFGVIVSVTKVEDVQGVVSSQVLCPLYQTLKSSESAKARANSANPAAYDQLVQEIQHSINVLGCTHS